MIDNTYFFKKECPICNKEALTVMRSESGPLSFNATLDRQANAKPNLLELMKGLNSLPCYVRLCLNCGYVDFFSKNLIDESNQTKDASFEKAFNRK